MTCVIQQKDVPHKRQSAAWNGNTRFMTLAVLLVVMFQFQRPLKAPYLDHRMQFDHTFILQAHCFFYAGTGTQAREHFFYSYDNN